MENLSGVCSENGTCTWAVVLKVNKYSYLVDLCWKATMLCHELVPVTQIGVLKNWLICASAMTPHMRKCVTL